MGSGTRGAYANPIIRGEENPEGSDTRGVYANLKEKKREVLTHVGYTQTSAIKKEGGSDPVRVYANRTSTLVTHANTENTHAKRKRAHKKQKKKRGLVPTDYN